jgi:exosortase/archaeosortase family protein
MARSAVGRVRLSDAQRFGLRFFGLLVLASVFTWAVSLPNRLGPAQRLLAGSGTAVARLTGGQSSVFADQIAVGGLSIDINYECTGVYVALILVVFLFAYPAPWHRRLLGAAIGIVGLTIVNVLRIAVLVRIAELSPDLFSYFHEYVWQGVFLILVIAYAMAWVERSR